jgi:hypothetical protein
MRATAHLSRRALRGSTRSAVVIALLSGAFLVIVLLGVKDATRRVGWLDHRRAEALAAARTDPALGAGYAAGAFRSFRSALDDGSRFTLVYDASFDRNERGFYRLFSGYYLYPAVAVSDPAAADAVMVFGAPPRRVLDRFDQLAVVDGVWLGRRRSS